MEKKYGALLSSSVNPQELSHTVQSFVKVLVAVGLTFGYFKGVNVDTVLEQVPVIVGAGITAWQTFETVWGAIRKVVVALSAK